MSNVDPENRNPDFFAVAAPQRAEPQLPANFFRTPEQRPETPAAGLAPTVAPPVSVTAAPLVAAAAPLPFEDDAPMAPARFSLPAQTQALLGRLADLLRRRDTPTPFAVGLMAPAGGGKTSALRWLTENLGSAGAPVVALRAGALAAEPERALAAALYRALSTRYPALANEAAQEGAHMGADAGAYARAAHEKLDAMRRKLMQERQNLAQTEARRAALTETLLYDTPGSRVDSYVRRLRGAFEPRLRRFGFSGDSLASFKDLVRDLAETGGLSSRLIACSRAVYAFRGQVSLLVYAATCFALNWGAGWLIANKKLWLGAFSYAGAPGAQASEFVGGHLDWLPTAGQLFTLLGLALLGLNLWRAFGFMQPLFHGAGLLDEDVAAKRHELDHMLAHQARSVDLNGAETAAFAKHSAEAERRASAAGASRHPPLFLETDAATQKQESSRGFLECLSGLIADAAKSIETPDRLIVTVDGFETANEPAALFDRLHDLLARPGFVTVYALDPETIGSSRGASLVRRIQLPLRLDAGQGGDKPSALAPLDTPLSSSETRIIDALSPLAGGSPRLQKRLRNLFRFLRPAPGAPIGLKAALALFLAADLGASPEDRRSLDGALVAADADFAPKNSPLLQETVAYLKSVEGPIDRDTARRAASLARHVGL